MGSVKVCRGWRSRRKYTIMHMLSSYRLCNSYTLQHGPISAQLRLVIVVHNRYI